MHAFNYFYNNSTVRQGKTSFIFSSLVSTAQFTTVSYCISVLHCICTMKIYVPPHTQHAVQHEQIMSQDDVTIER